jgi:hypothetical protein
MVRTGSKNVIKVSVKGATPGQQLAVVLSLLAVRGVDYATVTRAKGQLQYTDVTHLASDKLFCGSNVQTENPVRTAGKTAGMHPVFYLPPVDADGKTTAIINLKRFECTKTSINFKLDDEPVVWVCAAVYELLNGSGAGASASAAGQATPPLLVLGRQYGPHALSQPLLLYGRADALAEFSSKKSRINCQIPKKA